MESSDLVTNLDSTFKVEANDGYIDMSDLYDFDSLSKDKSEFPLSELGSPCPSSADASSYEKSTENPNSKSRYKHVPHREKPVQVVVKRNARERRRVQTVNGAFTSLRKHIPYENRHKRLSKVKTLHIAIDYIKHLQELLGENDSMLSGLLGNGNIDMSQEALQAAHAQTASLAQMQQPQQLQIQQSAPMGTFSNLEMSSQPATADSLMSSFPGSGHFMELLRTAHLPPLAGPVMDWGSSDMQDLLQLAD